MDSVENIRKNKRKLFVYSVILLIVGLFFGFGVTSLLKTSNVNNCDKIIPASNNSNNKNDDVTDVAKNLLKEYMNYYDELLFDDEKISYDGKDAYLVSNAFKEIKELFTSDITIDKIYNYYDYGNMALSDNDSNKPVYTQVNDLYYFDGVCKGTGNKLVYSDFKVLNRTNDTINLGYVVTIMSIVDNTIMESSFDEEMIIKLEDGSWKINKASIIGRCGLPYEVG